jgi:hypothetical protein
MRNIPLAATALTMFAFTAAPAWAVNKCILPDGKVVFQDAACEGKGERLRILGAGQADPSSLGTTYWRREAARIQRKERAETTIAQRQVFVGMSAEEVRSAWGEPNRINSTLNASGKSEQWVYRREQGGDQYVYSRAGVVSSIQFFE